MVRGARQAGKVYEDDGYGTVSVLHGCGPQDEEEGPILGRMGLQLRRHQDRGEACPGIA